MIIFSISFCVKSLQAVDVEPLMHTAEQPGGGMSSDFDSGAVSIRAGHGILFPDNNDPSDTALLAHAPGYSIFLSAIYSVKNRSYFTVQLFQNAINSVSPVLLFLIAGNLLSWRVGIAGGLLAAVSHHLSYYSTLILSDSLCPLPILIAVYLLVRAISRRNVSLWLYALAGVMIGLSAWIRPNPMLMGLFCGVVLVVILRPRRGVMLGAIVLASVSFLTIAPITIRNYLVYREFVPIQVGIGLNLWEGLGDASGGRYGAITDDDVILQEIAWYGEPRYGESWASPDGIMRDRARVRRSLEVIADHPVWYVGTVIRRMGTMLKDSADAPLVFRSTDKKLQEALTVARSANQTRRKLREESDEEARMIDRSALTIGRSISWMRAPARAVQRATKETGLLFVLIGLAIMLIISPRRTLFILMVPIYYFLFQSVMHTEFRYALTMRYFLFVCAAIVWTLLFTLAAKGLRAVFSRSKVSKPNPS